MQTEQLKPTPWRERKAALLVCGRAKRAGDHRGLQRAEHVVRGETRELGRACDLLDNQVEWLEQPPEKSGTVQVYITVLEEPAPEPLPKRGRMMAEALAELARRGTFADITDPIAWQRELRSERALPDREA